MMTKRSILLIVLCLTASAFCESTQPIQDPCIHDVPPCIAELYADSTDKDVSDEFNTGILGLNRWAYRTQNGTNWGTGTDYVYFVTLGNDSFVSIKGNWSERKGSGLSAKREVHFGFYSIRWRTANISPQFKTPWHPAIWMAGRNFASGSDARAIESCLSNIEIDFVEYWHQPIWYVQTIAWDRSNPKKTVQTIQKLRTKNKDFPTTESGWQVHGLEYHPHYLQLWQKVEGQWKPIGRKIPINDEPTSHDSLHKAHAQAGYWILSNKYHWENVSAFYKGKVDLSEFRLEDSALQVDYFRYFPLKYRALNEETSDFLYVLALVRVECYCLCRPTPQYPLDCGRRHVTQLRVLRQ